MSIPHHCISERCGRQRQWWYNGYWLGTSNPFLCSLCHRDSDLGKRVCNLLSRLLLSPVILGWQGGYFPSYSRYILLQLQLHNLLLVTTMWQVLFFALLYKYLLPINLKRWGFETSHRFQCQLCAAKPRNHHYIVQLLVFRLEFNNTEQAETKPQKKVSSTTLHMPHIVIVWLSEYYLFVLVTINKNALPAL